MGILIVTLRLLVSGLAIGIGGWLASIGKDGWGWFLVVGLLLGWVSYSSNKNGESDEISD